MIADNVKVSLFGNISDGLYSAYVSTNGSGNQSAYVVTRKEVRDYFDGIVVAVAEFEGLAGARPIVATPVPQRGKWDSYNDRVSELASAIRALAATEGVTCVDLHSAFGSGAGYIQSDGLHLTDAGGALVARKFAAAL